MSEKLRAMLDKQNQALQKKIWETEDREAPALAKISSEVSE